MIDNDDLNASPPEEGGYNQIKIWMSIAIILILVGGGVGYVIFNGNTPASLKKQSNSQMDSGSNNTAMPMNYAPAAKKSIVDDIVNSSVTPNAAPVVPPITGETKANASSVANKPTNAVLIGTGENSQITTSDDSYEKQAQTIITQQKLKRLQQRYAAYSSKTNIPVNPGKEGSSAVVALDPPGITSKIAASFGAKAMAVSQIKKNQSPYVLKAGSILPCVMISGLNSDVSGHIIAQVSDNVYDSISGTYLLIPQGTRLVGNYNNGLQFGQNRIPVAWNVANEPNGDSVDLKGVPGADLSGFNGLTGDVDNHYSTIFGASFVMSAITAGAAYSQNSTNGSTQMGVYQNPTFGQTMASSLGQQLGQTGTMITQKALNVSPTIVVPQGAQFTIMLTQDLVLAPYQG